MAEATSFNLSSGIKAERKLLVTCVDVSDSETPEWVIVGRGVEDSSIEFNPDTSTTTDILGITDTTVNKLETEQDLDPCTVRGGDALAVKLYNQVKYQRLSELSNYNVLIIYAFVGDSGAYEAEMHKGCTITPQSIGGDATVDMPININFSNNKTHGTVNGYTGTITFTPAS